MLPVLCCGVATNQPQRGGHVLSHRFERACRHQGRAVSNTVQVVDLFSGPGGLAEGFAGYRDEQGDTPFEIALSVEKERSAYRTLLLRAFLRKFGERYPSCYYSFLNDGGTEPNWTERYPMQWDAAVRETLRLEIGTAAANVVIDARIRGIRQQSAGGTVLLGGPPCQSYSLVGRARNTGNASYDSSTDGRLFLYQEYVRVMKALRPAVAIMENVKGMLSARTGGRAIIDDVVKSLQCAAGADSYRLFAVAGPDDGFWEAGREPSEFLVRAEQYGIPQARHRVILVCVRRDIDKIVPAGRLLRLKGAERDVSVSDMIGLMPRLRSRISRGDCESEWRDVVRAACETIGSLPASWTASELIGDETAKFQRAIARTLEHMRTDKRLHWNGAIGGTEMSCPNELRAWVSDPKLRRLPNHETRGHMRADIARYLFASAFAEATSMSPKSVHFPEVLAPNHANWRTGKFSDRFRVQLGDRASSTVTSHISKDGHYFIHPDPTQCRSLTVREAARLQTFPDNYLFLGGRTQQYVQVGNAVPPYLARQLAGRVCYLLREHGRTRAHSMVGRARRATKDREPRAAEWCPETVSV